MKHADTAPALPSLQQFMQCTLPQDGHSHILAFGEDHDQKAHYEWLSQNLETLRDNHNLGTLGIERNPYLEVFLWAYRDGNLPVGNELYAAKEYLQQMIAAYSGQNISSNVIAAKTNLYVKALDLGLDVVCFDARDTLGRGKDGKASDITSLKERFAVNPDLDEALRKNVSGAWDALSSHERYSFMLMEVDRLCTQFPQYARRLNNVEAVIDAANADYTRGIVDADATSAAILLACQRPGHNTITLSGLNHIMGLARTNSGTFALHLPHLKTTTALAGNADYLRYMLRDLSKELDMHGHPFHVPSLMVLDENVAVQQGASAQHPWTHEIKAHAKAYHAKYGYEDRSYPTACLQAHLNHERKLLKTSWMSGALNHLHSNRPWADTVIHDRASVEHSRD